MYGAKRGDFEWRGCGIFLKRCPAVLLSAALLAAAAGTAAAADTPAPTLGIYTTGDMGGRLYREDPVTGRAVEYSYQNVASAMEAERASVDAAAAGQR